LIRYVPSGTFYARIRIQGKLIAQRTLPGNGAKGEVLIPMDNLQEVEAVFQGKRFVLRSHAIGEAHKAVSSRPKCLDQSGRLNWRSPAFRPPKKPAKRA
jgi:hypothetical protein